MPRPYEGRKALYLEDEPDRVDAIVYRMTEKIGLEVVRVITADEAVHALREQRFDLLVLDVRIFGADHGLNGEPVKWSRYGVYILESLRAGKIGGKTPSYVPTLVVTAVVATPDVEMLAQLGQRDGAKYRYVCKPVDIPRFERAVDELLS